MKIFFIVCGIRALWSKSSICIKYRNSFDVFYATRFKKFYVL